jgi:hypothetical protein
MDTTFINQELVDNSEFIKLIEHGISKATPVWEDEYSAEYLMDVYKTIDTFANLCYHDYDKTELLFIYKSVYELSGIKDSLELLGTYMKFTIIVNYDQDDLKLDISIASDIFKDFSLAIHLIRELSHELLVFKNNDVEFENITIQIDNINKINSYIDENLLIDKVYNKSNLIVGAV